MDGLYYRFCIFAFLALEGLALKVQYNGDQVLKVMPQTSSQADFLQDISNQMQLDLWKPRMPEAIIPGTEVHVRVPFSLVQNLKEQFQQREISFEVLITDVQNIIDQRTMTAPRKPYLSLADFDYTKYHPMHQIYDWMVQIREKYSDVVTLHYLGPTYEERPIFYFKIGWPSDKKKKVIWMDCGIHAREWIAVAFCQWFIKEILENQHTNPVVRKALHNVDFYVVPVLNIDGFIYSWTTERLWRKNRTPYNNGTCYGVDLNRNFDARWCSIGASRNCTSLTFCGSGPNSEPETMAVSNLVESIKSDILCFLTIHSYSQLILLPYGYTQDPSQNHDEMLTVAQKAAEKLKDRHGTPYTVGSSSHILYSSSGSSRDWAADQGISLTYTFELRDNGTYGFQLPEIQIKPTCEETTDAVLTIIDYVNEKYFNSATSLFFAGLRTNLCFSFIIATYYSLF